MDRKTYIKKVYSKYWLMAREKKYGFLEYDKNLCNYICANITNGAKLLEVAIGTGYPFADFFQKKGYSVYGIDISSELIQKCKRLNSNINCKIGDAEKLEFPENYFDFTYCFHATWYFPNLNKAIAEMLRVTRHRGFVMFDIQNRNNKEIENSYKKHLNEGKGIGRYQRYAKNIVKIILRRGFPDWNFVVYETPTYPQVLYKHLSECNYPNTFQIFVRTKDDLIEAKDNPSFFEEYDRLVFVVKKT